MLRRLFQSKIFRFWIILIFLVGLMLLPQALSNRISILGNVITIPVNPVQSQVFALGQRFGNLQDYIHGMDDLKKRNAELEERMAKLDNAEKELEALKTQNQELRDAVGLRDQFKDIPQVGANIIGKDPGNWFNTFLIDRGSADGLRADMPVVCPAGLVGRITTVYASSSKVTAIIDDTVSLSARITRTRDIVVVRGDPQLREKAQLRLDYIPSDVDVTTEDTVETSGLGGIFPKNIRIGKIIQTRTTGNDLSKYAIIKPSVDFKRLEQVWVLKTEKEKKP